MRLGTWEGSLTELITALEGGGLDAREVPLAAVVAQAKEQAQDLEGRAVAFALACRVVELKARALLPSPPPEPEPTSEEDPEAEAAELAARVAAYQAFAEAAEVLREFEMQRRVRFGRPSASTRASKPRAAELPEASLEQLLGALREVWQRAAPRTGEVERPRFTMDQALSALRARLAAAGTQVEFSELFASAADRLEIVLTFLALLEVVRLREAQVVQDAPFGPVRIRWSGARAEGAPRTGMPR